MPCFSYFWSPARAGSWRRVQGAPWWWGKVLGSHPRCGGSAVLWDKYVVAPCLGALRISGVDVLVFHLFVSTLSCLCVSPWLLKTYWHLPVFALSSVRGCCWNLVQPTLLQICWPRLCVPVNLVRSFWYGPSAFWSMLSSPCYHWPPRTPQRGQSQDPSALDASLNLSNTHSPLSQLWKEKSELHWNLNPSHLCFPMTLQPPPPPHPAGQENGGEGLSFTGQPMAWPCLAPERGANPLSQSCLAVGTALALRNPLLEFRSWNYSFLWISSVFLLIPNLREPLWKPGSRVSCLRTPHDGQATSSIELILLSL